MPSPSSQADPRASHSPLPSPLTSAASVAINTTTTTASSTAPTAGKFFASTPTATSTPTPTSIATSDSSSPATWTRRIKLPNRSATHPDFLRDARLPTKSTVANHGRLIDDSPSTAAHARDIMADSQPDTPTASSAAPSSAGASSAAPSSGILPFKPTSGDNTTASATAEAKTAALYAARDAARQLQESASQKQLNDYREKLARDLELRELAARGLLPSQPEKTRVSPILEDAVSNSPMLTNITNASTESGNTIRGGITPAPVAGTPSYPFPRMASGAFVPTSYLYKSLPPLSPVSAARVAHQTSFDYRGSLDRVMSENSTPASILNFNPSGSSPYPENFDFPTPNLYDLSLMLSAEPGLDAWWNTVVQIMKDVYKAERVTLAVPADTTDIENVPWGQKATYNDQTEDDLSLGYVGKGSSTMLSSEYDTQDAAVAATPGAFDADMTLSTASTRPGFPTRHSFTTYEDNKSKAQETVPASTRRPAPLRRSKTQFPSARSAEDMAQYHAQLDKKALDDHDAEEEQYPHNVPSWEAPFLAHYEGQGRVLPVLQALDYEADPLIDHTGIARVLQRGKAVALTRSYPYLTETSSVDPSAGQRPVPKTADSDASLTSRKQRSDSGPKISSIFSSSSGSRPSNKGKVHFNDKGASVASFVDEEESKPPTPKYEEYEQAPPSPWSQSPAPSPAVRADTKDNPFFTDAMVDEETFNPGSAPADYTGLRPPEAIGIDNSWTVLHIPLTHVLLSKPTRPFKLNASAMEQRSQSLNKDDPTSDRRGYDNATDSMSKDKSAPIAILSILSPMIPYPSNLRHSLENLAPHMATSFSLCRHYSNLETELAGIQRRRPPTTGFGAVAPYNRPVHGAQYFPLGRAGQHQSLAGSMTSPSDYSALSRSAAGSPLGTPGWDQGPLSYLIDKRQPANSPAPLGQGSESYFSSKQKQSSSRPDTSSSGHQRSRTGSKDNSPSDPRHLRLSVRTPQEGPSDDSTPKSTYSSEDLATSSARESQPKSTKAASVGSAPEVDVPSTTHSQPTDFGLTGQDGELHHQHTMLHSYGADFTATFQSLPPSSSLTTKPPPNMPPPSRSGSLTNAAVDMPPPSDRLKGLILDSLPAHVFVALPQTGEIVWVNSRYLSYRGQTVASLAADPWGSIHADDRKEYLKAWGHSLRTGEQFSRTVRIKRFDGSYRWFYARALASKDKRGVIMQFLGSYMDIHDQHIAELKAARQEEIEASEAKHRLLANLIPQIIFTATEDDGITFANEQWLSYTGQSFGSSLALGFMDHVHPDDLAKCRIPLGQLSASAHKSREAKEVEKEKGKGKGKGGSVSSDAESEPTPTISASTFPALQHKTGLKGPPHQSLSRTSSSSSESIYELHTAELTELAKKGIIKVATDANGRVSYTTEVRLRSKAGEYRWHLIRCVEIDTIDFGQGASSYFGSATDINDHKLLEAKLKEAMESKGRFLSNMSHEIRTPLIGISGMVSFLQDTILNEEQRDYTNTIQTSANSLIMIINDILDLSKVDAGMMKLKFEWFHTRSLIEDVNELVSTMAIAKRLELNYLVEADVPAWVKGDKVRIRQVLLNVIGNAIKFTSEGEVFSRCKVFVGEDSETGAHEIMLQFSITDTGQGFSKKEAELIFKPFSQIDGSSTRQHGGSGLGLVISRQLVELHGGKMEGTAVLGKGSTFAFTARFALPTAEDHPALPGSPSSAISATSRHESLESVPRGIRPLPPARQQLRHTGDASPEPDLTSPSVASTGSSNPSLHSGRSHLTDRSSVTSVNTGLARFSEAAKASGHDLSQMRLDMPFDRSSPGRVATPDAHIPRIPDEFRPPVYSILIICPQYHSREATTQHIEMTLPKDVPHQITALGTLEEAQKYIGGDDPIKFTHIVINLGSAEAIINVMDHITESQKIDKMTILILSDSVQRQAVMKQATGTKYERLLSDNLVTFIYKPVKPSRFAVIFDPDKVRDLSTDRNRSTAQQMVESQKASYQEIEKRMGNKGYRILLVEDNLVNQKVLMKYLEKIGVDVEVAIDGVECTDRVLSKPHSHYSLILCDLHMPRKDGYQACREIRKWESASHFPKMPIIALSANVMSDVQEKCISAGFSDYVTKPVDFIDLSRAMAKFF